MSRLPIKNLPSYWPSGFVPEQIDLGGWSDRMTELRKDGVCERGNAATAAALFPVIPQDPCSKVLL